MVHCKNLYKGIACAVQKVVKFLQASSWTGIQENAPIPVTAFWIYGYVWDKNRAYSIPFILCFLTKEGDNSCWSLKDKDQFVDLEIICIVSSILKWLKAKWQKPDPMLLCTLSEYGYSSRWYHAFLSRKLFEVTSRNFFFIWFCLIC